LLLSLANAQTAVPVQYLLYSVPVGNGKDIKSVLKQTPGMHAYKPAVLAHAQTAVPVQYLLSGCWQ
jgi:hypothetical protein